MRWTLLWTLLSVHLCVESAAVAPQQCVKKDKTLLGIVGSKQCGLSKRRDEALAVSLQRFAPPRRTAPVNYGTALAAIAPGESIREYQLVERTAVLGMCGHDAYEHGDTSSLVVIQQQLEYYHNRLDDGRADAMLLDGPSLEYQCSIENIEQIYVNQNYRLRKKFEGGSHGEVWRALRVSHDANGTPVEESFILKRIFVELGEDTHLSGQREAYFGDLLRGEHHVARFVEAFYRDPLGVNTSSTLQELWLVFYDEGISLRHYLYTKTRSQTSVLFEPSIFWRRMRTEEEGADVLKEILRQLIQGIAAIHDRGITHRDIKPSNILISQDDQFIVKLADLGSAIDGYTHAHLYGDKGPTQAEETREYQPPEVLFHGDVPYDYSSPTSYDMWSIGVVFLELVLGSPQVFSISSRARAKVDAHLQDKSELVRTKSYLLQVLTEYCIFQPPSLYRYHNDYAVVHSACNFGTFNVTIQKRDPLGRGLEDPWALHLLWKLLQWDPAKRITAREALDHAYFRGPYICNVSNRAFATKDELSLHQAFLESKRLNQANSFIQRHYDLPTEYFCPCGRVFSSVDACSAHLNARRHNSQSSFCRYAAPELREQIQPSIDDHIHVDTHLSHGYAMFNGRRRYMEDMHLVDARDTYDLYAVMDGHMGTGAASFVRKHLATRFAVHYKAALENTHDTSLAEDLALRQTLADLHAQFVAQANETDFSGTTLTVLLHFHQENRLVTANVGDSRAVLYSVDESGNLVSQQLTTDHSPNDSTERSRIESSGGFVSFIGVWRVMGQLAVSRTLGDRHLNQYISCDPSISRVDDIPRGSFLILASDGVWETLDNQLAGRFVQERRGRDLYDAASELVIEAFVRGSSDNLFAMVLDV